MVFSRSPGRSRNNEPNTRVSIPRNALSYSTSWIAIVMKKMVVIVPLPKKPKAKPLGESRSQAVRHLERSLRSREVFGEFSLVVGFIPTRREKRNSKESLELIRHYFINSMYLLCIVFVCYCVLCAVLVAVAAARLIAGVLQQLQVNKTDWL